MKSLLQEYFVLRTNAIQRKRFQSDQVMCFVEGDLSKEEKQYIMLHFCRSMVKIMITPMLVY